MATSAHNDAGCTIVLQDKERKGGREREREMMMMKCALPLVIVVFVVGSVVLLDASLLQRFDDH